MCTGDLLCAVQKADHAETAPLHMADHAETTDETKMHIYSISLSLSHTHTHMHTRTHTHTLTTHTPSLLTATV